MSSLPGVLFFLCVGWEVRIVYVTDRSSWTVSLSSGKSNKFYPAPQLKEENMTQYFRTELRNCLLQFQQQGELQDIRHKAWQKSGRYYTSHVEYKMLYVYKNMPNYQPLHCYERGQAGVQLLETLRYRFPMVSSEFFFDIILSAVLWPPRLTHPLTEMSTRNIFWWVKRPVCMADNLATFICKLS